MSIILPKIQGSEEEEVESLLEKCWLMLLFPVVWFSFGKHLAKIKVVVRENRTGWVEKYFWKLNIDKSEFFWILV